MLHKNVIENNGGFRTLRPSELTAVGGGYYDENPIPGMDEPIFNGLAHVPLVAQPYEGETLSDDYDGDGQPGITVTPDAVYQGIENYGTSDHPFYALLDHQTGNYIVFDWSWGDYFLGSGHGWLVKGGGTFTLTIGGGSTEFGTSGINSTTGNITYSFKPG